jgi:hypothetical protein
MMELPDYPDLALIAACEERIVNAWPAPSTLMVEGWVVRFANGYSGRANSASPLKSGATLSEEALALIERLYAQATLPPCIRLTPLTASGMARRLAARGYRIRDRALGMVASLAEPSPSSAGMHIEPHATRGWIEAVAALQSPEKNDPEKLAAIVTGVRMPAAFATLAHDGAPVALGMGARWCRACWPGRGPKAATAPICRWKAATLRPSAFTRASDSGLLMPTKPGSWTALAPQHRPEFRPACHAGPQHDERAGSQDHHPSLRETETDQDQRREHRRGIG